MWRYPRGIRLDGVHGEGEIHDALDDGWEKGGEGEEEDAELTAASAPDVFELDEEEVEAETHDRAGESA